MEDRQRSRSSAQSLSLDASWSPGCTLLLLILAGGLSLGAEPLTHAIPPLPRSEHKGGQQKQIEQLEEQWRTALLTANNTAIAALLADDYVGIGPDGTILSRSGELQARASGLDRLEQLDVEERKIRIYGTTAVVTSKVKVRGVYSGQPLLGEYRYTRVWSMARAQWRIVSFEANRIHDASARSR